MVPAFIAAVGVSGAEPGSPHERPVSTSKPWPQPPSSSFSRQPKSAVGVVDRSSRRVAAGVHLTQKPGAGGVGARDVAQNGHAVRATRRMRVIVGLRQPDAQDLRASQFAPVASPTGSRQLVRWRPDGRERSVGGDGA